MACDCLPSRGYSVVQNYYQLIDTVATGGFSYSNYCNEILANRPVLIQLDGHTMLGVGFDTGNQIIVHDTWDNSDHTMVWGGSYSGMKQEGVTVIQLAPAATVTGTVWNDANGNGVMDSGESGLAGWTVYVDADNSGTLNGVEQQVTTDASGNYTLSGLPNGTYTIREVPQSGWQQTTLASLTVTVASGQTLGARTSATNRRASSRRRS